MRRIIPVSERVSTHGETKGYVPRAGEQPFRGEARMSIAVCRRIVVGLSVVLSILVFRSTLSAAPIVFSVAAAPNPIIIPQNLVGFVTFTVSLDPASPTPSVVVNPLTLGNTALQFLSGDIQDQILGGTLEQEGTCFRFVRPDIILLNAIGQGESCTFVESFRTRDIRDPDPDLIDGQWSLNEVVEVVDSANSTNTLAQKVLFFAVVTDQFGPIPGPSTLVLLATGFAGLLSYALRTQRG